MKLGLAVEAICGFGSAVARWRDGMNGVREIRPSELHHWWRCSMAPDRSSALFTGYTQWTRQRQRNGSIQCFRTLTIMLRTPRCWSDNVVCCEWMAFGDGSCPPYDSRIRSYMNCDPVNLSQCGRGSENIPPLVYVWSLLASIRCQRCSTLTTICPLKPTAISETVLRIRPLRSPVAHHLPHPTDIRSRDAI